MTRGIFMQIIRRRSQGEKVQPLAMVARWQNRR